MKLRNKKTGEIVNLAGFISNGGRTFLQFEDDKGIFKHEYETLEQLNKEWEDYEEPKEYWFLSTGGEPHRFEGEDKIYTPNRKSIGNYFNTREEAEKAMEKLKAWKRLKDYNVKFNLDFVKNKIDFTYTINNPLLSVLDGEEQIFNNMKIVFGGEE